MLFNEHKSFIDNGVCYNILDEETVEANLNEKIPYDPKKTNFYGDYLSYNIHTPGFIPEFVHDQDGREYKVIGLLDNYSARVSHANPYLHLPDSLEYIEAFDDCAYKISYLKIPKSLKRIRVDNNMHGVMNGFKVHPENEYFCEVDGVLFSKDKKCIIKHISRNNKGPYIIPDGVEVIGDGAFYQSFLENIIIPNSVKRIGKRAFDNTIYVKHIDIPEGVKEIDDSAFSESRLETISLPSTLKCIGNNAFAYSDLKKICIPETVESIGTDLFLHCEELTYVSLPDCITTIPPRTFFKCKSLSNIHLPKSTEVIKCFAFYGCEQLRNVNFLQTKIRIIEKGAFNYTPYCGQAYVTLLPETIKELHTDAFGVAGRFQINETQFYCGCQKNQIIEYDGVGKVKVMDQ